MITYQLIRTQRKTLAIHILKDATVQVRAPKRLSKKEIEAFIQQKEDWILKKQALMKSNRTTIKEYLQPDDVLWFQGKEYPIQFGEKLEFTGERFILPNNEWATLKPCLITLYQALLSPFLQEKAQYYAKVMNVKPNAIKINSARKRWGSCSGKNSLNFSFMLAMVSEKELEYVVVHELAHIKQHNHSSAFWNEVKAVLPDYLQREQSLKQMQKYISAIW